MTEEQLLNQWIVLAGWKRGYKRTFNGVVYLTKKDRRIAYKAWLDAQSSVRR